MYFYQYVGTVPVDLPTIGKRDIQPNDMVESSVEINNPLFKKVEVKAENEVKQERSEA